MFVYSCCGLSAEAQEYTRWVNGKAEKPSFTDIVIMVIDQKRRIWTSTEKLIWERKGTKCWAIGSGADYALGAMMAGANAIEAVRIATKLDVNTGLGVDWVRF